MSERLTESQLHALTSGRWAENDMGLHYDDPDHPFVLRAVELALADTSVQRVLEFGTGRGHVARELGRNGMSVVATDINPVGLQELTEFAYESGLDIQTRELDAGEPLPEDLKGQSDMVVAKDVLPFMPPVTINTLIANFSEALRENGVVIFSAPVVGSSLYNRSTSYANDNGDFTRKLTEDDQRFLGTKVSRFNFVDIDYLREKCAAHSLELTESELFGRSNGWMWAVARKNGKI